MYNIDELICQIEKEHTLDEQKNVEVEELQKEFKDHKKQKAYNEINDIWVSQVAGLMREALNYANIIILGAYIAYFTIWTNLLDALNPYNRLATGVLIGISAAFFVFFEVYKVFKDMTRFSNAHVAYEKMNEWERNYEPEKSIALRKAIAAREDSYKLSLVRLWQVVFAICVLTGVLAVLLLAGDLVVGLFQGAYNYFYADNIC